MLLPNSFTVNGFVRPTIDYRKALPDPTRVCFFAFSQGNPFPGPFQEKATHTVYALYQFQTMTNQSPTQADLDIGVNFALCVA